MSARDRKDSLTMSRLPSFAAVIALGLAASACAPIDHTISAANNPTLYSMHQPVVQRTDFVIDLATQGDRVPAAEQQRLRAWLQSIDAAYGDRISIDEARGYESAAARADIGAVAADYGLLLTDGAPVLNGEIAPGSIRVIASRATASVPGCPEWDEDQITPTVNSSANYGCATNANLAALIANPDDLIHGQSGQGAGSALVAGRAVNVYRTRPPTGTQPLQNTSTTTQQR